MPYHKPQVVVIVGPNASGKSKLGVSLARRFRGEIISADSRQVYRGLTIGTGKIQKREMRGIPHHLLDITNPRRQFSVIEFKKYAEKALSDIIQHGHTPIVVGGTGFWIDTLIYNRTIPEVPPNETLRRSLAKKSADTLLATLQKLDPKRARTIEQKNPRRLIRAIEIALSIGQVPKLQESSPYKVLWIGIQLPRITHEKRIRLRLRSRIKAGMIDEAKQLHKQGISWKRFHELGLEYRFLAEYLQKKILKKEMMARLERATRDYSRRQMTWFKRNKKIHWIRNDGEAERLVKSFLT
jgi:tRNA dimethylallyltransferase